jgi:hypothetical protein
METLQSAVNAMRHQCYFGSVDLSEAFYSIPIKQSDRKYFRFYNKAQKYQFTALIMGLSTSPRVFTKILKPVFASLRKQGHISTAYIDDSCLQGATFDACLENIKATVLLMDSLGLTVNTEKSVLRPSQQIVFLGFLLCSITMTVRLVPEKCREITQLCNKILLSKRITIRKFLQLIGKLVAAEPGVEYGPLYYKPLEKVRESQLRMHRGNYDSFFTLPQSAKSSLKYLPTCFKKVSHGSPDLILYSDASNTGWGAFNKTYNIHTGGEWNENEQKFHINILELKAFQLTVMTFCKHISGKHVRVFTDNTTTCSYINNLGGKKTELNSLARDIWSWCIDKNIHITAEHVLGNITLRQTHNHVSQMMTLSGH